MSLFIQIANSGVASASGHGNTEEYEDVKFFPNELCTVAIDTWENLRNQLCQLFSSTDEHPKQSVVGWQGMLNEIMPDLVSSLFLLTCLYALASLHNYIRAVVLPNFNTFNFHLNTDRFLFFQAVLL
jgi:hypothetical protein